jgi:ankyrin repeat protein
VDVNAKDIKGRSAFFFAYYFDDRGVIREFLKHQDVDVNASGTRGETALMWACLQGQRDSPRWMCMSRIRQG